MNNIVPFDFKGNPVRVIEINGEPWFVGKDVAQALGYANPQKALRDHCKKAQHVEGERNVHPSDLDPQTKIIPESDVYRLIIKSKLPEAEKFETLVMEEILPTIRKTGGYGAPTALSGPQLMAAALIEADATMKAQAQRIEEMRPKVEAIQRIEASQGSQLPTVVAKLFAMPQNRFFKELHAKNWIYKRGKVWVGYEDKVKRGYLENDLRTFTDASGEERSSVQLKITPKGVSRLAQIYPGGTA
ncbi:phage antirepressor [Phaeobacter sp. JH20_25]|uniref:BRO family protein n=1 Tax=Phaeobacter sp. JH20_25 TaxID=3112482 RepID=UPI003A8B3FFB